jgi:1-deoxy-D-xylulose-5-phosphate reductoisomerase
MAMGGAMPAVLNAADEVAVSAFLSEKLSFLGIYEVVARTFEGLVDKAGVYTLDEIINADREARRLAAQIIKEIKI